MPQKPLLQVFKELSFEKKLLGIGSVLLVISSFLPWYQDLDSFKTGDMYLGVTGPLYLAGFSLLALAALNLVALFFEVTGRKVPFFQIKSSSLHLFSGLFAFFMLMVVNSVYFHSKFGLNITMKQSQFGMFFAFISASFLTIGGYLAGRDKVQIIRDFQEDALPVVKMPQQEIRKPKENLRGAGEIKTPVAEQTHMGVVDESSIPGVHQPAPSRAPGQSNRPYQPFRTDL